MGKGKRNRIGRLFGVSIAALVVYLAVSSMVLQVDITSYQAKLAGLEQQCADQEIENEQLSEQVEKGADYDYVIRTAREKLGLIFPEEQVFYNASGNQ